MLTARYSNRLSPLHALNTAAGAIFADVAGWQVVKKYSDVDGELQAVTESVGVCDITGRSAVRVKSFRLDDVLGKRTCSIGSIVRDCDAVIARLTSEEALAIGPRSAGGSWQAGIDSDGEPTRHVIDVTSGLAGLRIAGPLTRDVLASLTDLDLRERAMPDGSCAQAGFAQVQGTLLRLDVGGAPAYELYVAREYGVYMWEVIIESLGQGMVVPFGDEALRRLERRD
jgi:heterotetrameric sarcosine oxidase gamma subunit